MYCACIFIYLALSLCALQIIVLYCIVYTVGHRECATLFWTITSVFLDEFLHFLYQWKQE